MDTERSTIATELSSVYWGMELLRAYIIRTAYCDEEEAARIAWAVVPTIDAAIRKELKINVRNN